MSRSKRPHRTILHFGTDRVVLLLRAQRLGQMGYRVLSPSNGFEAIELAAAEPVDAVVLDLDRNSSEIALVAREIKLLRPQLPTVLLTDGTAPLDGAHELADALVPRRDNLGLLVAALEGVLATRSKNVGEVAS